jgi:hypothetical protein
MRRRHAPQGRFAHLFTALHDALTDLERKTLPAAEEGAAAEAPRPRINREGGVSWIGSKRRFPPLLLRRGRVLERHANAAPNPQ